MIGKTWRHEVSIQKLSCGSLGMGHVVRFSRSKLLKGDQTPPGYRTLLYDDSGSCSISNPSWALPEGNFLLDMVNQKIVDENLIRSGFDEGDIEIKFTGLRPREDVWRVTERRRSKSKQVFSKIQYYNVDTLHPCIISILKTESYTDQELHDELIDIMKQRNRINRPMIWPIFWWYFCFYKKNYFIMNWE